MNDNDAGVGCAILVAVGLACWAISSCVGDKPKLTPEQQHQLQIQRDAKERIDAEREALQRLLHEAEVQDEIRRQRGGR